MAGDRALANGEVNGRCKEQGDQCREGGQLLHLLPSSGRDRCLVRDDGQRAPCISSVADRPSDAATVPVETLPCPYEPFGRYRSGRGLANAMAAHEAASGITQFHALSSEWQATDHRVPIGKAFFQVDRGCNAQRLQIELPAEDLRRSCCQIIGFNDGPRAENGCRNAETIRYAGYFNRRQMVKFSRRCKSMARPSPKQLQPDPGAQVRSASVDPASMAGALPACRKVGYRACDRADCFCACIHRAVLLPALVTAFLFQHALHGLVSPSTNSSAHRVPYLVRIRRRAASPKSTSR